MRAKFSVLGTRSAAWLFLGAVLLTLPVQAAPAALPRALWVWNTAAIRSDPAEQARFFRFLAAPHGAAKNKITILYFDGLHAADFSDPNTAAGLRRFLKAAHSRRLRVDFLTGDPHWATPIGQGEALSTLRAVLAFNKDGAAGEQYDGFQYDVEPYTLPEWPAPALQSGLLELLDKSKALIKSSGQKVIFSDVIPRWFDQDQFHYLDRSVIDRADETIVMDYVTSTDLLVSDADDEMAYAAKVGKKVWVGVETGELPDTPRTTFFGAGIAAMEQVLTEAKSRFQSRSSFAGYAIHHWASYDTMQP